MNSVDVETFPEGRSGQYWREEEDEKLKQAALRARSLSSIAHQLGRSYLSCFFRAIDKKFSNIWDRPFRFDDVARLEGLLRPKGVTWTQLAQGMRQGVPRLKAFMAQENIDAGTLGDQACVRRDRMVSAKSVIRLPAVNRVSAFSAPQCSEEIFPLDVYEQRKECKTSWRCLSTSNGIVAVDLTRSSVSLAAFMRYIKWEYADLHQWTLNRDDAMLHDAQLYWQKPYSTLLRSDDGASNQQLFKLGFWLPMRSAFRLFVSLGFWQDAFFDLFSRDSWSSHTIKPILDDDSQFVCPTCIKSFKTAIEYETHAIFHVDGWPRLCNFCYAVYRHETCYPKKAGVSPYPISFSGLSAIHGIRKSLEDPLTTTDVTSQPHEWASIFASVRFSKPYSIKNIKPLQDQLRDEYKAAFNPVTTRWGIVNCERGGRPSTKPVFRYGSAPTSLLHDDGSPLPREGRILLLIQSLEGLTTNLQSLVTMRNDLDQLDVQLGFCTRLPDTKINIGQKYINGIGWSFYSLSSLVDMLLGRVETTPTYEKLINAWFLINRSKAQ